MLANVILRRTHRMGARQKLNAAFFNGCLLVAAVAGALTASWPVFLGALALAVVLGFHSGEIRLRPPSRDPRKR
jgi:hypothetical protein